MSVSQMLRVAFGDFHQPAPGQVRAGGRLPPADTGADERSVLSTTPDRRDGESRNLPRASDLAVRRSGADSAPRGDDSLGGGSIDILA